MAFMAWNDKLSLDIPAIDQDHKKLLVLANDLYDGIQSGESRAEIAGILVALVHYTQFHFAREEEFFANTGYPDAVAHKREHDEMVVWTLGAQARHKSGSLRAPSLEVMSFLKDWLYDHILGSDHLYAAHLKAHGIADSAHDCDTEQVPAGPAEPERVVLNLED